MLYTDSEENLELIKTNVRFIARKKTGATYTA